LANDLNMSMKHWWHVSDTQKMKYLEENLSRCQTLHRKSHMD